MTYSIDIINLVISKLINKQKITKISETLNLSITTINKWKYLYKNNIENNTYITKNSSTNIHGLNKKNKYIDSIKLNDFSLNVEISQFKYKNPHNIAVNIRTTNLSNDISEFINNGSIVITTKNHINPNTSIEYKFKDLIDSYTCL